MNRLKCVRALFDKKALFFVVTVALASCPYLYSQNAPACGTVLASFNSIPAYSNGADQWTENDCDPGKTLPPYGAYGEQFQCTEFVKRYYSQALGISSTAQWTGDAIDWGNASWATPKGLTFFPNNGSVAPATNDIVVFSDPLNGVGHVAIITSVSSPTGPSPLVTFIEQNWSVTEGTTLPSLPYTYSCTSSGCSYTVSDRHSYNSSGQVKATFQVIGWIKATSSVATNPTPSISLLKPAFLLLGSPAQTLTINGSGFIATSTATFNGTARTPTYLGSTQLTISLSATDLQAAGTFPVVVANPGPGGGSSNTISFIVNNPAPSISSLSPSSQPVGAAAQTLTINGSGFLSDSAVTYNGAAYTPIFVNANQLTISLSSSDLSTAGTFPVVVTNPTPGGGQSNSVDLVIGNSPVTISPSFVTVPIGLAQTFSAKVAGGGGVSWSVEEGNSGGSITNSGIYTAPMTPGTYHVMATSVADSSLGAAATVSVTSPLSYSIVYNFGASVNGSSGPLAGPNPLIQESGGVLFGTAAGGGNYVNYSGVADCYNTGCGGVFDVTTSGTFDVLHTFIGTDGGEPGSGERLAQGTDGAFYGTTTIGGSNDSCSVNGGVSACGTLFRVDTSGNFSVLHSFNGADGAFPIGGLVLGADGKFYGATSGGGVSTSCTNYQTPGCGTVFNIDSSGNLATLHEFTGPDGIGPSAQLVQSKDGNFYGTASLGGSAQDGTIFKISTSGSFALLHSFSGTDGNQPNAGLIQASDGDFYGVTPDGGSSNLGTIFRIDSSGTFMLLHSFSGLDGSFPSSNLIQASDGFFYGTTSFGGLDNMGTVFRMDTLGNVTVIHSFAGSDGTAPSGIMQASDGSIYGSASTSASNGSTWGAGIIFRITP